MKFTLQCDCGHGFEIRPSSAGTMIQCPLCRQQLSVPSLSVLRTHAERGERTPCGRLTETGAPGNKHSGSGPTGPTSDEIPKSIFAHYSGEVSSTGRASASAMENYSSLVVREVESLVKELDISNGFELLVSCALLPENRFVLQIDSKPAEAASEWESRLEERIGEITRPPIQEGPVAFMVYRRMNVRVGGSIGLTPFRRLKYQIGIRGVDAALMQAGGLEFDAPLETEAVKPSWWQRLFRRLKGTSSNQYEESTLSPQQIYEETKAWIESAEGRFADIQTEQLRKLVHEQPSELANCVGLAAREAEEQNWKCAIENYSHAISLAADSATLYGRRAGMHLVSENHQAALADYNRAIELAPLESRFFYHRSQIFAGLEAWEQATSDLDAAIKLAPREPAFLIPRAQIWLQAGSHQQAIDDLSRLLSLDPNCGPAHAMLGWIYQQPEVQNLNRTVEHLSRAIEFIPDQSSMRIQRSLAYASQNKFEMALEDCQSVLHVDPESSAAHGLHGRILQMQGEFSEAVEACTRAIDLGLEAPLVFVTRGFAYAATDQQELAILDCDAALALDPDNALALQLRGSLSLQRGELDAAMDALTQARELAPEWSEPREQIALLHRMNENPQAAIDEQNELIEQQPSNPAHYVNRAFAYTQLGDYEKAEQDYGHALELDGENEQIHFLRGCFFMDRQEEEKALDDMNRVLELDGNFDDARLRRAGILLRLRRQDEALKDYEKLIAKYPDHPLAYTGRAWANQMKGDDKAAEADIDRLDEIAPEKAHETAIQSLHGKVVWLESQERYKEAIQVAEEIIVMAEDEPIGYRLRGWIRWYTEQHVEACEDYSRLLEMTPDEPDLLNSRGQILAEMGEWDSALDDLNSAVEMSRESGLNHVLAFALSGRAFTLAGLDRMDESTRDYEESVQLCPANSWVYYNRGIVMYQRGDQGQAKELLQTALEMNEPPLTKRKRERAEVALDRLGTDSSRGA